jgi:hypothetical protein
VPAIPPCIQEPRWDQLAALLQPSQVHHPLGCHRQRIPDRVVFDKLIQILVFGCGYRRIAGYITGYRVVLNPEFTGRAFDVMVAVDINATDRQTTEDFEAAIVAFDEVIAVRRLFGQPDYLVQVAVADAGEFEAFLIGKLIGLPALSRTVSHLTMKRIKG